MDDLSYVVENERGKFRALVYDSIDAPIGFVKWDVCVWIDGLSVWFLLTKSSLPLKLDLAINQSIQALKEWSEKYVAQQTIEDETPEPDKTVVGLDEMFSRLHRERIRWVVNHERQLDGIYWPYVEVGGFGIHLPGSDLTAEKLLAALEEGYGRVMRQRESINDYSKPIKPNKPWSFT